LSVSLSRHSTAAASSGGFAAKRLKQEISIDSGGRRELGSNGAAARHSAANAGSVMLTDELTRLRKDVIITRSHGRTI